MSPALILQFLLPHKPLSRLARALARCRWRPLKDWLIGLVVRRYDVDLAEAEQPDPRAYEHFNAFFTRALRPGARTPDPDPAALLMPADGRLSQAGRLDGDRLLQAKGRVYTLGDLLGSEAAARPYRDGWFATVYLAPRDYHRVHMPWSGTLRDTLHVPGRLFTVSPAAVAGIPRLYARNERLVCHFETDFGPMCMVMVGALLVSGIETVWGGEEIPPYRHSPRHRDWQGRNVRLARFAEMARFNYGSTVIVVLPRVGIRLAGDVSPERPVRVGQRLGTVNPGSLSGP